MFDINKLNTFGPAPFGVKGHRSIYPTATVNKLFSRLRPNSTVVRVLKLIKLSGGIITRAELNEIMGWERIEVADYDYRKRCYRGQRIRTSCQCNTLFARMRFAGLIKYNQRHILLGDNFEALVRAYPKYFA